MVSRIPDKLLMVRQMTLKITTKKVLKTPPPQVVSRNLNILDSYGKLTQTKINSGINIVRRFAL